jgi:hypothetical protein
MGRSDASFAGCLSGEAAGLGSPIRDEAGASSAQIQEEVTSEFDVTRLLADEIYLRTSGRRMAKYPDFGIFPAVNFFNQ